MRRELRIPVCLLLVTCTITPLFGQLPTGWTARDIGNPAAAGSVQYDPATGTWTICGDGTGIRGTSDQFYFVYKTLTGDGELTARVASLDPPLADWSMAGVMIRVLLIPESPYVFMGVSANTDTQDHGVTFWGREAPAGPADHESAGPMTAPYWVRIRRAGDTFTGFTSPDGKVWTERYSSEAAGIPQSIYIGYAVSSEVGGKLVTAVFDNGPRKATDPDPADGAKAIVAPILQWTAGVTATAHEVYLGTGPDLGPDDYRAQLPATMPMYFHTPGLTPGTTYYWRVDETEADGKTIYPGDTWSFTAQALTAYLPEPPDGGTNVSTMPTLVWQPGQTALKHHLFFGNDLEAVTVGTSDANQGTFTTTAFTPGPLDSVATYYWRVDEILPDGTVQTGPVWSLTTCLPVDDFESAEPPIWEVWLDGWTNGTGSQVGYLTAPFLEEKIVHGGRQSMPMDYDNVAAPWYSEAEREWATPQDWLVNGANTLVLDIRGLAANAPAAFYVTVEDKAGHVTVVAHPDSTLVTTPQWTEWRIPLADLTSAGVNVAAVKKIYLGVGDRDKPSPGGAGRIYLDDIRVIRL